MTNEDMQIQIDELQAQLDEYRLIIENQSEVVIKVDTAGAITFVSPAYCQLKGKPERELLGTNPGAEVHPDDAEAVKKAFVDVTKPPYIINTEFRTKTKDGFCWMSWRGKGLRDSNGNVTELLAVGRDISERKKTEIELHKSNAIFETIFEASRDCIVVFGRDFNINFANRSFHDYMALEEGSLIGKNLSDMPAKYFDLLKRWRGRLKDLFKNSQVMRYEDKFMMQGRDFHSDSIFAPIIGDDGLVEAAAMVYRDVTFRLQAIRALGESERKYKKIFDNALAAIMRLDSDGIIVDANARVSDILELESKHELIGRNVREFIAEDDGFEKMLASLNVSGHLPHYEMKYKTSNENHVWMQSTIWSAEDGKFIDLIGIDITSLIEAREATAMQQEQLVQADKMIALGTLVSGVAHEINNPTQFVMLNTPILKKSWEAVLPALNQRALEDADFAPGGWSWEMLSERVPQLLSGIQDGADRIRNIVADLKDFVRQDTSKLKHPIDVADVINASFTLARSSMKNATDNFTQNVQKNIPRVMGNKQKLEQVIINLLINSCEALTDRSKSISISARHVEEDNNVEIVVEDEGEGISEEAMRHITDPFFTTKRESGGTGLGLSISASLIDQYDGKLSFESEPGKGTRVTILLPVVEEGASE